MTRNLRTPLMCTAVLALVVLTARPGQAQTPQNDLAAVKQGMGAHVMADHQKMMADMKASQKKLDDLVAAMNQATGDDKVDKLAAVVTEMVAQHREMCGRMMSSNMMMPMSMMQHTPEATAPAPTGKPEDDHATHHPKP
jgi:hypothetical protein